VCHRNSCPPPLTDVSSLVSGGSPARRKTPTLEEGKWVRCPQITRLVWRGVQMDDGLRLRIGEASRTVSADNIGVSALDRYLDAA